MGILKKLASLRPNNEHKETTLKKVESNPSTDYSHEGYETSKSCQGSEHTLKISLETIYQKFENDCKIDLANQERLKQPYTTELKGKTTALLNKTEEKETLENEAGEYEEQIEKLRQDTINVRRNPLDYGLDVDKRSTAKFWIGLLFLLPLTAYILIFYISTSYSAFFRTFDPSTSLFTGIFYPKALSKAYEDGLLELGFVLFIPFVFFALGYLIHMFQSKKGYVNILKIVALFIITFLFDSILAYLIEEKLYNLNKTFDSPDFNIPIAFQSVGFWLIIFAGFVSYIVWGLVFDFVMKEHTDRDKIQCFIKDLHEEIQNKEKSILKLKGGIKVLQNEISDLDKRIAELQNIIDGFILPIRNYKLLSAQYLQGWQKYVDAELAMGVNEKNDLQLRCRKVYDTHIKNLELDTDDYQNKVYTKTL
ncbi:MULTISPECIES: hypothetical protein [Flavobacteriaceae]|uniref:hypothetical protein n=1 Tax=Flavobacteriaceae TaxID=49546 RepID=UPI00234914B1|nr:hypothetical protein [Muricauda sp. SP22]MDC6363999.1 hypothetical protein [Muricauda sp. SP22]